MLRCEHRLGQTDGEHATRVEKHCPINEQRSNEEIVAGHDDADAFRCDLAQESIQVKLVSDIKVCRRFIEQQVRAELSQGTSHHDALALAATELSEGAIRELFHPDTPQAMSHEFTMIISITNPPLLMRVASQFDDLPGGEGRIRRGILRHDRDVRRNFARRHPADGEVIEEHGTCLGSQRPVQAS